MKTLKEFILATTFAVAPLLLNADSTLYDIQFEVNGSTYVLSNQTLPLDLTVDEYGTGSLDDILKNLLCLSQYCRYNPGSCWSLSMNCPIPYQDKVLLDCSTGTSDAYRLTISDPFEGYAELSGEYETTETYWDPELEEDVTNTYTTSFSVTITIPNYNGSGNPGNTGIAGVTSADIGKVIASDGNVYADASEASLNGTTAEAMIAYVDMLANTGIAIALEDVGGKVLYSAAESQVQGWAANHPIYVMNAQGDYTALSGEWRLPSKDDWTKMFSGCGGSGSSGLRARLVNAGGTDVRAAPASVQYLTGTIDNDAIVGDVYMFCYNFCNDGFVSVQQNAARGFVRPCLAFDIADNQPVTSAYETWATANGVGDAWDATDADGIANVFRYAFNVPSDAFSPITNITFNAAGKAIVATPAVQNTSGFTYSVVASDDVGGTENVATYLLSTDGTTLIDEPPKTRRFFRLRAELE